MAARSWQVPLSEASETQKLGWIDEACQEGEAWQKSQRGFNDWGKALDIISGDESVKDLPDSRSKLSGKRLKTNIRVAVAGLSNVRPIWGWHSSKAYAPYAQMMNKTARALYLRGSWDQNVKAGLMWAFATGVGFLRPVYRRSRAGMGKGRIEIDTCGAPAVLPVQMPSNGDWNSAYSVTYLDEQPIWMAHGTFWQFQDKLKPTQSRYWYSAQIRAAAKQNLMRRASQWFSKRAQDNQSELYIPIRYTRTNDLSLNTSGFTKPMGQLGASWYYEVPSLGSEMKGSDGKPRIADENDARMYPRGRLMISSENCVMYDGPQFNWCPDLDLIPLYVDWWPWEPMGLSPIHDGWELQKAVDEISRSAMDKVRADMNRSLAYNLDAMTEKEAREFDPLEPNNRIGYDGSQADKPFTSPLEESFYEIHPQALQMRELLLEELDDLLQTRDIKELMKARGIGKGMDDVAALSAANGPLVRDIGRTIEKPLGTTGSQVGWLMLQYMTTAEILQYVGMEGLPPEMLDYKPSQIVPSHMPGEDATDPATHQPMLSKFTDMERARWFADNVQHFLLPHSAHEFAQMSYRLTLAQLKQRGLPVSDATVMSACEVADVEIPDGQFEQDRWREEQKEKLLFAKEMSEVAEGSGMDPSAMGGKPNGSTHKGGRPPSAQAPPHLASKDGGSRTTIAESH